MTRLALARAGAAAAAFALATALALTATPAYAVGGVVDNTLDDGTPGTLRYELLNAPSGSTITFGPIFHDATPDTISLSSGISIPNGVTIDGPGSDLLTITGAVPLAPFVFGFPPDWRQPELRRHGTHLRRSGRHERAGVLRKLRSGQ